MLFLFLNTTGWGWGWGFGEENKEAPSIVRDRTNMGDKHFGMLTDRDANSLQSVARQLSELIARELKINYYKIDFCTFYIHILSLNR